METKYYYTPSYTQKLLLICLFGVVMISGVSGYPQLGNNGYGLPPDLYGHGSPHGYAGGGGGGGGGGGLVYAEGRSYGRGPHRGGYGSPGFANDLGYGEGYGNGGYADYCQDCNHCNGCGHAPVRADAYGGHVNLG